MINGIIQTPLRQICDERGKVMHMLKATDPHFDQFGEVYFSWIYPGYVKAWSKHLIMNLNYAVPVGCIKLVLFDDRLDSLTHGEINEFYMNSENYYLLTIPCGLWYGFKAMDDKPAMIVNCATIPHNPKEIQRLDFNDPKIPYVWEIECV